MLLKKTLHELGVRATIQMRFSSKGGLGCLGVVIEP